MKRPLLLLALLTAFAATSCKREAPVESAAPEAAKTEAVAEAPAPVAVESAPAASAADVPFDVKGFAGSFSGTLPCADCPGIDTRLTLANDGTFTLEETYQGRKDGTAQLDGTWTVEADDTQVRLDPNSKTADDRLFEIVSNAELRALDKDGRRIESALSYSLRRDAAAR